MNKWDAIRQFSKRTGITDPNLDAFIKEDETDKESLMKYSTMKGISDPRVDYWLNKREEYIHSGVFYGIDWGKELWPTTQQYNQPEREPYSIPPYTRTQDYWWPNYRPYAAQRRFHENYRLRRRNWVLSDIRAWDDVPLSEAKKQNNMPDGEKIDLIIMDEAKEIEKSRADLTDEIISKTLDSIMPEAYNVARDHLSGGFYGGFGGMICHATRERDNYVDGNWNVAPKKLPEHEEAEETWENPLLFPAWLTIYG